MVDPRTIIPLDEATILTEVTATGKALLVQEAPRTAGFAAEIAARIAESDTFHTLKAPLVRLCGLDVPMAYGPELEKASVPQIPTSSPPPANSRSAADRARDAHRIPKRFTTKLPTGATVPEVPIRMPEMSDDDGGGPVTLADLRR